MKKMIIILGCILLGCYIFTLLLGDQSTSLRNMQRKVMEKEIQSYHSSP